MPGKVDWHPQQNISWSEEVSEVYLAGNYLEYRVLIPKNKSSDDCCRYYSYGLTDGDMNSMDLQLLQKLQLIPIVLLFLFGCASFVIS